MTLLDDEDVEILHDSQAAAEESALQILPHSTSNAPASGTALAKQVGRSSFLPIGCLYAHQGPHAMFLMLWHPLIYSRRH